MQTCLNFKNVEHLQLLQTSSEIKRKLHFFSSKTDIHAVKLGIFGSPQFGTTYVRRYQHYLPKPAKFRVKPLAVLKRSEWISKQLSHLSSFRVGFHIVTFFCKSSRVFCELKEMKKSLKRIFLIKFSD